MVAKTTFSTHEAYSEMRANVRLHPMGPHTFTFPLMEMEDGVLAIAFYTAILADIHYSMLMIQQLLIFISTTDDTIYYS